MTSTTIIIVCLIFYVTIALASAWERNWYRAMYYVGAIIIQLAVLGMTAKAKVD